MFQGVPEVDVKMVAGMKEREEVCVLDVREQWEYDVGHIPGVLHLPMSEIQGRMNEIPTDKKVIVACRSGQRSARVTAWLLDNDYDDVHNMAGGILAWDQAGYKVEQGSGEPAPTDWLMTYNMLTRQRMMG